MKKNWIVLLCFLIVIIGMLAFGYSRKSLYNTPELSSSNVFNNFTSNLTSSQENSGIEAMTSRSNTYTVKEYKGHIGIFYNDERIPYQEIDVEISSLPSLDQELLRNGIKATDTNKLNGIIEDYES